MKVHIKVKTGAEGDPEQDALDPALAQALSDFKANVHLWSEAEFNRPRAMSATVVRRTWQMASGWVLVSVLVAGALSGGLYERHHRQELARIAAAARIAEQQRELAAAQERAKAEDDLFAKVDSDVSQEVPDALEPLAELSAQSTAK